VKNIIEKWYSLNSIPYLNKDKIPKAGKLENDGIHLEYKFHGSGCTFILDSIELDYSIYADQENYIVVSPWGFTCFVNTYLNTNTSYTEAQVAEWLELLNFKDVINKIYEGYFVYEVSFAWYKAFRSGGNE
jgi:hypothetical protein